MENLENNLDNNIEKNIWWKRGLKFFCMGCGRCCRGEPGAIFFNQEEFNIIAQTLGISRLELREKYVTMRYSRQNQNQDAPAKPSFKEKQNGECIFYDTHKARCTIYPVRPSQCRTFPFWPEVLKSRESWDKFAKRCPGMNEGELFSPERINELIEDAKTWFEPENLKKKKREHEEELNK